MTRGVARAADGAAPGGSARAVEISSAAAGQAAQENFPVALRLLPGRRRRQLAAVYAFARTADDLGDEAPVPERLALLDELEADIHRLYRTLPGAPPGSEPPRLHVVRALGPAVAECAIPAQPFLDLIEANRQDQRVTRYPSFDDLLGYCRLSANPVGRIVLAVFGARSPEREALSDQVCTALQLVEHLQDVAEDRRAGRVYLPAEDLARFGCEERDLDAPSAGPGLRDLVAFEAERAQALLKQGGPLIGSLRGAARAAIAGYVAGGRAALAAIASAGHDVLSATPRPGRGRLAAELVKAYATGR